MTRIEEEREMLRAFEVEAGRILASGDRFEKAEGSLRIGFESEVAVLKAGILISDIESLRDAILSRVPEFTDRELGVAQMELRTMPFDVLSSVGFGSLKSEYEGNFARLLASARRSDSSILRCGTNPFLPIKDTPRTNKPKYRLVPDFYNDNRRSGVDTVIGLGSGRVDIGDAAIVSLFQSFQVNLEARSFRDAIDKVNRSFGIAPYLLALSANSRYLGLTDTGVQDLRMLSWERSHDTRCLHPVDTGMQDVRLLSWEKSFDTRTLAELGRKDCLRVGLPETYFRDMEHYLSRAGRFPFILYAPENALNIAIGMTWLDSRVKFIGDSLVVELRLLPTQPTIDQELLLTLLYIGKLFHSQSTGEAMLPLECVRENRLSAMVYGMDRSMWFVSPDGNPMRLPFREGFTLEITKIVRMLEKLGLSSFLDMDLLNSILENGSPSTRLGREVEGLGRDGGLLLQLETALRNLGMIVA